MQEVFSGPRKTSEHGTLLRMVSRERCVVQLGSTMAVVCLQLDAPLQDPLYTDMASSARPEAPLACAVVLGTFHLGRGEYTGCRIHVSRPPHHPKGAQAASKTSAARRMKYKDYKQPFCGLPGLLPVFL